jgi:transcriptional regulator GlxA family with amidase domain
VDESDRGPYPQCRVIRLSVGGGLIESDCPGLSFGSAPAATAPAAIDTLILPGGLDAPTAADDPALIDIVRELAGRARRVASVCTGAFLAAEAGLLTGRRAATHWRYCDQFAERFPDIEVERDRI